MKKQLAFAAAALLCVSSLVSCGSKSKNVRDYSLEELIGYVTVGNYTGLEISQSDIDSDVADGVATVLSASTYDEETDAPAVDGNKMVLSYVGSIDGTALTELTFDEQTVTLGTGTTKFDEIDAILEGLSVGDTETVTLTIPDGFTNNTDIDGKEATFTVSVSSVLETLTPTALTDAIVSTYSEGEYTTVAAYEDYLTSNAKRSLAWSAVVNNCTILGYPSEVAEQYYNNTVASYSASASQYGLTLESLVSLYGMDIDTFYYNMSQQAIAQTEQEIILNIIGKKEKMTPSEDLIQETAEKIAAQYSYDSVSKMYESIPKETVKDYAMFEMVYDFIVDNAVIVD